MIIQDCDFVNSVQADDNLQQKIQVRKTQLQIALESNMHLVAEILQQQLDELQHNSNFHALMSLLD